MVNYKAKTPEVEQECEVTAFNYSTTVFLPCDVRGESFIAVYPTPLHVTVTAEFRRNSFLDYFTSIKALLNNNPAYYSSSAEASVYLNPENMAPNIESSGFTVDDISFILFFFPFLWIIH